MRAEQLGTLRGGELDDEVTVVGGRGSGERKIHARTKKMFAGGDTPAALVI